MTSRAENQFADWKKKWSEAFGAISNLFPKHTGADLQSIKKVNDHMKVKSSPAEKFSVFHT